MTYLVLARKWRPRSFDTLVGQDHVVRALTHALQTQRLHHAWLFTGTRGVGKTTLSRLLAKSLNCETGITATPCGQCRACVEIDEGRFVDYVELDAASNRGVDEMTQLLEQAVYAPGAGRFKVYMIDEVHMLTGHAFNAMLKTLEEPPAHVKFILATTDPQKIPVTVLSRCLQFNLKQMTAESIVGHLQGVLQHENISFEVPALRLIAQAAAGSMRDALSLTDQAIAYSAGQLSAEAVRGMLGTIDQRYLVRLLEGLAAGSGHAVLEVADELATRGLSYSGALADLCVLLSRIAIEQRVSGVTPADDPVSADIVNLAARLSPDVVQLFYTVAVHSRSELSLSPDEYAGFVMACLRMLSLVPVSPDDGGGNRVAQPSPGVQQGAVSGKPVVPVPVSPVVSSEISQVQATGFTPVPAASAVNPLLESASGSAPALVPLPAPSVDGLAIKHVSEPGSGPLPASASTSSHVSASVQASAFAESSPKLPEQLPESATASSPEPAAKPAPALLPAETKSEAAPEPAQISASGFVTAASADDIPPWEDMPDDVSGYVPDDSGAWVADDGFETMGIGFDDADAVPGDVLALSGDDIPERVLASLAPAAETSRRIRSPRLRDMDSTSWPALAAQLPATGVAAELARQSEWVAVNADEVQLRVAIRLFAETQAQSRLCTLLSEHFGTVVRLKVEYGETGDATAHAVAQAERAARQREAEQAVETDPVVLQLLNDFGATVIEGSIRHLPESKAA
ncbi:DNA polymerase III subunit gamma/tau [Neopusillimonas aromaticivorans]|uniref:DNA polymerase III subunit gamma/tau n=1 Tax=Neopusillimonas aromaticivorans TaxID=2979868 RepID=UPI002599782B|nr:DNA polymerase III subunit gamma/tau [Neopusillimonas aromaticivorans]WJJ94118.1 DNA polymerase III subunit gamma/tau [Neopusillimonas aromaticivorans]